MNKTAPVIRLTMSVASEHKADVAHEQFKYDLGIEPPYPTPVWKEAYNLKPSQRTDCFIVLHSKLGLLKNGMSSSLLI